MRIFAAFSLLALLISVPFAASFQAAVDDPDLPPPGFDVQTRGPVHEAFAAPNDLKVELGIAIPKEPPPLLPEQPPEERPERQSMEWIPGYWAWDSDRNDFVWVSGVFREPPPGRRFIPGHWINDNGGHRWVPGFWAPEVQDEMQYVPEPPASIDQGPSLPAPDESSTYVPGYWVYRDARYAWRPGYWSPQRPGRIWIHPRYVWTPSGYVFIDGYWDYPLEDRGVIFAPVAFAQPYWNDPAWVYRPRYVVSVSAVTSSFFFRTGSFHFYFGDFYGASYLSVGYQPWWQCRHDPLFGYYRWHYRGNPGWVDHHHRLYADRVAGRAPLPPRTYVQQRTIINNTTINNVNVNNVRMIAPIKQAAAPASGVTNVKFVANNQVNVQKANADRLREVASVRAAAEKSVVKTAPGVAPQANTAAIKIAQPVKLPPPANRTANLREPPRVGAPATNVPGKTAPGPFNPPPVTRIAPPTTPPQTAKPPVPPASKFPTTTSTNPFATPPNPVPTQPAPRVATPPPQPMPRLAPPTPPTAPPMARPQTPPTTAAPRVQAPPPGRPTPPPSKDRPPEKGGKGP